MDAYQFSEIHSASAVAFSPGSTFVATAWNASVHIRSTSNLEAVQAWQCESSTSSGSRWVLDGLQWSPSGSKIIAFSSKLGTAWVFDLTSREELCKLAGVDGVEWGGELIVAQSDRGLTLHDLSAGRSRFIQNAHLHNWSPHHRYLAVVEKYQGKDHIGVYDHNSLIRHFSIPTSQTSGLLWSPCGKWLAVWDWPLAYSVHIFSPVGAAVGHFEMATDTGVCCSIRRVTWAPNGRYLMIGDSEGSVRILESDSWSPITVLQPSPITCWREDPPTILPGTVGPRITQFTAGYPAIIRGPIEWLQFNAEGSAFFCGHDNVLQVYDFDCQSLVVGNTISARSAVSFISPIKAVRWCPVTNQIAAVTRGRTLYLWDDLGVEGVDVPSNWEQAPADLRGAQFSAADVQWSPDGQSVILCDKQSFCVVYNEGPGSDNVWEEVL